MTLYEIRPEIASLIHPDGDVNTVAISQADLPSDEKIFGCIAITKNLASESDAIDAEIKRLTARKRKIADNRERVISYMMHEMRRADQMKFQRGIHRAHIAKSPLSVEIVSESAVPDEFKKQVTEVRKRDIIDHIRATGEVPTGVEAFRGEHLRIS